MAKAAMVQAIARIGGDPAIWVKINTPTPWTPSCIPQMISRNFRRTVIKSLLNDIAAEVGDAIRKARLDFPVYLTVPNSGDALNCLPA